MRLRSIIQSALLIGFMVIAVGAGNAQANHTTRQIAVNGMRLHPGQIQYVDRLLGYPLPSGHYWHDARTGLWGRMGGPPLGRVPSSGYIQQGNGVGQVYDSGATAYRNSTTGVGAIIDPNAGGNWQDKVFIPSR